MRCVQVVATTRGLGRLDGAVVALLDTSYRSVSDAVVSAGSLELRSAPVRAELALDRCGLLPPLGSPRAVWGVGLNYHSKAAITGRAVPAEPMLFLSASSASGPADGTVRIPAEQTLEMDYEGEIALVIGRRLYQAALDDVWPAIAGITAANDMSARDVMRSTGSPTLAKSFPGFNPLGMSVSTVDELADRDRIGIRTWVNDELLQDDTSAGMIFTVPDLVARLSCYAALEPGDVVLTGTPAGTGQDRAQFLVVGDTVRVEVESVLPLVTTVAAPAASPTAPADPEAVQLADQAR